MGSYFLTNKAVEDITKIYEYTYEFWSEKQADIYYEELINFFQLLCENPYIGKNYTEIRLMFMVLQPINISFFTEF